MESGKYPKTWGVGYLVPIHKSDAISNPNNYRGITINSCFSKVFNSILNDRLVEFLNVNSIMKDEQIGFRKGARTADHIFKLKTLIGKYVQKNSKLYARFIDLRKAFDSVVHSALFYNLYNYNINGKCFPHHTSMYSCSVLRVKVNNKLSEEFMSEVGVKQGDNLNPLYSKFI